MARRNSNQRITKIKKDYILELLKKAEGTNVEDACSIQPVGSDLTPYPDLNNLRLWTRDYLLKGLTKLYPVNIDSNGQTFYTVLLDGLPLHTKLTKQISEASQTLASFINEFGSVTIVDTLASNFTNDNYFSINSSTLLSLTTDYTISLAFNIPQTLNAAVKLIEVRIGNITTALSVEVNGVIGIYQNNIKVDEVTSANLLNQSVTASLKFNKYPETSAPYKYTIDLESGTTSYNYQVSYGTSTLSYVNIGKTNTATNNYTLNLQDSFYQLLNSSEQSFLQGTPGIETSKPGLWLSNLVQPVSNSLAGSWLEHNFVHSNTGYFNNFNSDTIGNYSYSFYQRGVIHRTAGSTHDDNDSYCQHWSPSALSCISHDAVIIPENNLRSTYTSYQTYIVPSDPNMQRYDETPSKNVSFDFVDNNNNIPLTTTNFNGRVVGDGWTYELVFTPNGNGSGNDYGNGSNPSADNGSNGGCITGQIVYQDSVLGTSCTQTVNSCFQTNQSYFNPQVPIVPENNPLDEGLETTLVKVKINSCRTYCYPGPCAWQIYRTLNQPSVNNQIVAILSGNLQFTSDNTEHILSEQYISSPAPIQYCVSNVYQINGLDVSGELLKPSGTIGFYPANEIPTEENVNIYLNIIDLKQQYESEGLPWDDNNCGNSRFIYDFSTEVCTESYCKSLVIAENVNINSLGDISKLETVELSNL